MKAYQLVLFLFLSFTSTAAQADYFVIQDSDFGYKFSVPDRWYPMGGMDSRLTHAYMAPTLKDHRDDAGCAIASMRDNRFLVAEANELDHYVNQEFTKEFFEIQAPRMNIGQADALNISIVGYENGGLGDGFARYAVIDYTALSGTNKRSIMFATLYGDMQMIVSCQSNQETFERRFPEFMSVISSFDFEQFYRSYPTFYYRDFVGSDRSLIEIWFSQLKEQLGYR